jgi:hypothetical protein
MEGNCTPARVRTNPPAERPLLLKARGRFVELVRQHGLPVDASHPTRQLFASKRRRVWVPMCSPAMGCHFNRECEQYCTDSIKRDEHNTGYWSASNCAKVTFFDGLKRCIH